MLNSSVHIFSKIIGSHSLDRIEVIRNNRVIHTYSHQEKLVGSYLNDKNIRFKLRIESGWGPDRSHGFKLGEKNWKGLLEVPFGKIISVEPCFTYFNQNINSTSSKECSWTLTTLSRDEQVQNSACFAALVFEIEAPLNSFLILTINSHTSKLKVNELLKKSKVLAFKEEIEDIIKSQFSLSAEEIENPDVFWHHSYKVKIHRAVLTNNYVAELSFKDKDPPRGKNFYYLRVTQTNGQMGWSSPIWVHNE